LEESNIIEKAIEEFLKNRKVLRSRKIAVVGNPDSGKTETIRRFMFGERLSVLDEYTNEQQYLYDTDDTIFATSIEIDGEVFDLRIQDVSLIKVNKQFKLLNVEKVVPITEELKNSWNDEASSAEGFGEWFLNALELRFASAMLLSGMVRQGHEERTIEVTLENRHTNYWLKDVDVVIFIFSVV